MSRLHAHINIFTDAVRENIGFHFGGGYADIGFLETVLSHQRAYFNALLCSLLAQILAVFHI
jgi:hypothetical protein